MQQPVRHRPSAVGNEPKRNARRPCMITQRLGVEEGDTPVEQQPAAMQDFDPTYDRCGSKPVRLRASKCFPVCPRKRTSNRPFMSTRPDAGLATATERVVAGDKRTEIARRADQRRDGHTWRGTLETRCPSLMIHDYGQHEDRSPTHGYEPTREAAMAAFAKSWRGALKPQGGIK